MKFTEQQRAMIKVGLELEYIDMINMILDQNIDDLENMINADESRLRNPDHAYVMRNNLLLRIRSSVILQVLNYNPDKQDYVSNENKLLN